MRNTKRFGFTLVELLVVIGIIALLVSILLPALNKARQAATTVTCLANLKTIGQGMNMYASQNKGYIVGSPTTSGGWLYTDTRNAKVLPPGVTDKGGVVVAGANVATDDYITPLAQIMNVNIPSISSTVYTTRFADMVNLKAFKCPVNDILIPAYTGGGAPDAGIQPMMSYNTAMCFLFTGGTPTPGTTGETRLAVTGNWPYIPPGYFPKISKVGSSATKIYAADGGKFTTSTQAPDYNLSIWPFASTSTGWGGNWGDFGPWTTQSNSYVRINAYGNPGGGTIDGRIFAYRHGSKTPANTPNSGMKLNAVFYDGHGETLSEIESANPALWLPKGSSFNSSGVAGGGTYGKCWPDVTSRYSINPVTWTAP